MPAFPKSFLSIDDELSRIRNHYKNDLNKPCLIIGNGPSSSAPSLTKEEIEQHFKIRMNWFFLEQNQTYGTNIDAFFWSVDNKGLREALALNERFGDYRISASFQPHVSSDDSGIRARDTKESPAAEFDHWAAIATCPELARTMMSRPLPTQGMQAIAFAAIMGCKTIRLSGIDMYGSTFKRYAWDVPEAAQSFLKEKDLRPGYEPHHDMDRDLRFLETVRSKYDFELLPVSKMDVLEDYGVFDRSFSIATKPAPQKKPVPRKGKRKYAYVTHADGRYSLGAMALARSLQKHSEHKLIVMYSEPDAPHFLRHLPNVELRYVEKIRNPYEHGQSRFAATYTKLRAFEIADYDRLTFIDSDAVVLQNIDDLFEMHGFYAAPDLGLKPVVAKGAFNSGVFSFDPCTVNFADMILATATHGSSDGGDQGFLNEYFADLVNYLPVAYNTLKRALVYHPELIAMHDVKVLHYVGAVKPWDLLGRVEPEYLHMNSKWADQLTAEDWQMIYFATIQFARKRVDNKEFDSLQASYAMEVAEEKEKYEKMFPQKQAKLGALLDGARDCMDSGNISLAIYLFTRAVATNKKSSNALIELADAYKAIGDEVSEMEVLERAYHVRPDRSEIAERLDMMIAEQNKSKNASQVEDLANEESTDQC